MATYTLLIDTTKLGHGLTCPSYQTSGLSHVRRWSYHTGQRDWKGWIGPGSNSQPFIFASLGGPSAQLVHVGYLYACICLFPAGSGGKKKKKRETEK